MKRNASVELMRIIACLIVLACHCNFLLILSNPEAIYHTYVTGLLCDGVTVFWMITGFFIFNNNNYKKLWIHTLKKILIPLFPLYIVDLFFADFLLGKCSILESMSHGINNSVSYILSIFQLETPSPTTSHTWYVFAYLLIVLIIPIIKPFAIYLKENQKSQKIFLIISGVLWIANDVFINKLLGFGFHGASVIIPATLLVLWGYVFYANKELFSRKIFSIICPITFLLINMLRTVLLTTIEKNQLDDSRHLYVWYSTFGVINAILIITFCFSINKNNKESSLNKFICYIASFTYGIYLIHPLVQESALCLGFFDLLNTSLSTAMPDWAYLIVALLISTFASFIACFIICLLIRLIKKLFVFRKKK